MSAICRICETELETDFGIDCTGEVQVSVEVCPNCVSNERTDAWEDGHAEGWEEGKEDLNAEIEDTISNLVESKLKERLP